MPVFENKYGTLQIFADIPADARKYGNGYRLAPEISEGDYIFRSALSLPTSLSFVLIMSDEPHQALKGIPSSFSS